MWLGTAGDLGWVTHVQADRDSWVSFPGKVLCTQSYVKVMLGESSWSRSDRDVSAPSDRSPAWGQEGCHLIPLLAEPSAALSCPLHVERLGPVSVCLSALDIHINAVHQIMWLFVSGFVTDHQVLKVHRHCSLSQGSVPFRGCILFHSVDGTHCLYPPSPCAHVTWPLYTRSPCTWLFLGPHRAPVSMP